MSRSTASPIVLQPPRVRIGPAVLAVAAVVIVTAIRRRWFT